MKAVVSKSNQDPLAALCQLVLGEKCYTLAEANAMGCYTVHQIAAERGTALSSTDKAIRAKYEAGVLRRIKIKKNGGWAYGPK